MFYAEPSAPRFDTELKLKEDYDYTAQHIALHGVVARCDFIFASFKHRTNAGGAVAYRTPEVEQESIKRLQDKWGDAIRLNPRRENEILFDGKKVKRQQK
jgi:predicted dienelactone hydrolase